MKAFEILIVILSPFLIYLLSRIQMVGWGHGMRDLMKTKKQENGKEKENK